jgi:hypothetical protein
LVPAPQFTLDEPERFRAMESLTFVLEMVDFSVLEDHVRLSGAQEADTLWRAVVTAYGSVVVV